MDGEQARREGIAGTETRGADLPDRLPAGDSDAEASLPFQNVGQLKKAYRSLLAEFTRKCQRLSELERAGRETATPRAEQPSGSADRSGGVGSGTETGSDRGTDGAARQSDRERDALRDSRAVGFLSEPRGGMQNPAARPAGEVVVSGGKLLYSPDKKPGSLTEAGELFLKHLQR